MPPEPTNAAQTGTAAGRRAWRAPLAALLGGGLQALCFAPGPLPAWSLPFVQIATLAVLAALTFQAAGPRRAAILGWLFGDDEEPEPPRRDRDDRGGYGAGRGHD